MEFLETDQQALDAFARGQAFLVAAYLAAPQLEVLQKLVRRPLVERRVMVGDFPAKAYLFPKTVLDGRPVRDVLFGTGDVPGLLGLGVDEVEVAPARHKGCTLPFVHGREARTELVYKDDKEIDAEEKLKRSNATTALHRLVQRFSRITGMRVKFHADGAGTRSPMAEEPGTIHLITGSQPPGEHESEVWRTNLFGVQLHKQLNYLQFRSGAKGRGQLLKHHDGLVETAHVQLMGNNVYLLYPVISVFWEPSIPMVFCKSLGKAYEALLDGAEDAEAKALAAPPPDDEAFRAAVSDAITFTADYWEKVIKEGKEKIEAKRKELHTLYGNLREWQTRLEACSKKSFYTDALERLPKDRERILAMPEVERIAAIEGGVHVYTKPLRMEWQDARYPVGRFAIRVGKHGNIAVWGVESTHPDGIPHPHIAKDGGPCFGNASDAITKASADFRVADVVAKLIVWLTRGYTPELAEHKIEEWQPEPMEGTICPSTSRINAGSSPPNLPSLSPSSA